VTDIKVGEVYNYFDDGKIKYSRMYKVKIQKIIPSFEINKLILAQWMSEVKSCPWLYRSSTDYFIIGDLDLGACIEQIVFVRTVDDKWFSLGFWGGELDYDGSVLKRLEDSL
jgi:hypothetical protein